MAFGRPWSVVHVSRAYCVGAFLGSRPCARPGAASAAASAKTDEIAEARIFGFPLADYGLSGLRIIARDRMLSRLRDLYRHRALVAVLTARELKARYRGSVLGFLWSLLNPLLMLAVYTVVFQLIFPNRAAGTRPYALFLFTGLLPWNWLSAALADSSASLPTHGALLRKVLFPAEVLPAVAVLAQGIHFVLALPVLLVALVAGSAGLFDAPVALGAPLLQVPFLLALEGLFLLGVGLLLAALTVHFRDIKDLLGTALSLWFFATPVLYALPELHSPRLAAVLRWNPVAPLFAAWHDALFYGKWVPARTWGAVVLVSLAAFLLGYALFDRLRDSYAEAV